jgi:hypothetical protein
MLLGILIGDVLFVTLDDVPVGEIGRQTLRENCIKV